jgi:hypothetical protein
LLSSHDSAASCAANETEKITNRIPWVNHVRGQYRGKVWHQLPQFCVVDKAPRKNCKVIGTYDDGADTLPTFLGITERAIPKTATVAAS